ncbi:MAG: S8 family serine peptidase [Anaerolineaceae bacterium]|nr:S8 family serine peptidase [Anaerolineaceae bacterium]
MISKSKSKVLVLLLIGLALLNIFVSVQANEPITGVDLGVDQLTLEVGETYQFHVTYEPKEPAFTSLNWYITDDSVIEIDQVNLAVKGLKPGNARILAESLDKVSYAYCEVTVNGPQAKDATEKSSGTDFIDLPEADRAKITSKSINRYLDFIEGSTFNSQTFSFISKENFSVIADVVPGTEVAESERAKALGMTDSTPLLNLNVVTLTGTLDQILDFTKDNDDLLEIFEIENTYVGDPIEIGYDAEATQKAVNLGSNTENLTKISAAHNLGLTGKGTVIAVIDSGLNSSHEQFTGRVIAERCFGQDGKSGTVTYRSLCSPGSDSALPYRFQGYPGNSYISHGTHVTGIAAGKNGIAPDAKIIAIGVNAEKVWKCTGEDANRYACPDYNSTGNCCAEWGNQYSGVMKGIDFLIDMAKNGTNIAAVNMSFGGDKYQSYHKDSLNSYFSRLINAKIVPVSSSGNASYNDAIGYPAAEPNAFAVGALADSASPYIADFSNHSTIVDILAPGSNIRSAVYRSGNNSIYEYWNGTSMAAPMVSGGLALIKQAYPYNTVSDWEAFLKNITNVSANKKANGYSFSYSKPVLNFSNLKLHVMNTLSISGQVKAYIGQIMIPVAKETRATGYKVTVYDNTAAKTISPTVSTKNVGDKTYIIVSGSSLVNGHSLKLSIYRYHTLGGIQYKGNTVTTTVTAGSAGKLPKGWTPAGDKWYYYENGIAHTGWLNLGTQWYYFNTNGVMQTGWVQVGKSWYYMDKNGVMQTGWVQVGKSWYRMNSNGIMQTGWVQVGKNWYYMNSKGVMQTGWVQVGSNWYYMDKNGVMQTGWQSIGGSLYYMNASGIMQTGTRNIGGVKCVFNANGILQATGWKQGGDNWYYLTAKSKVTTGWKQIEGSWYHFAADGAMNTGWKTIDKKWYYFNKTGRMQTGWTKVGSNWYLLGNNGVMQTGWVADGGRLFYLHKTSGIMQTGNKTIDNIKYTFDANGILQQSGWKQAGGSWYYFKSGNKFTVGWLFNGGSWYYFDENGKMQTGWRAVGKFMFYFDANGKMYTGRKTISSKQYTFDKNGRLKLSSIWKEFDSKWYYFTSNGEVQLLWGKIGNDWYYFGEDGAMRTGWLKDGNRWFYLDANGRMKTGWLTLSGKWYHFGTNGVMQTGWQQIEGYRYYFNTGGIMLTGKQTIGGKTYTFDKNGRLIS